MGTKVRPRGGDPWGNVIDLRSFRQRQRLGGGTNVLVVHGPGKWTPLLSEMAEISTFEVRDLHRLRAIAVTRNPLVALVDGDLGWVEPAVLVDELHHRFGIPSVLILDKPPKGRRAQIVKRAFAAGLHDLLVCPRSPDEIRECLELLRKIRHVAY